MATADNIELDAQVERLRSMLDDPERISNVSSKTFPLRVWERMFALDRDRQATGGGGTSSSSGGSAVNNTATTARGGSSPGEDGGRKSPSQQLDATKDSLGGFSDASNSGGGGAAQRSNNSGSHQQNRLQRHQTVLYQQQLDTTKRNMRSCRSGALTSSFMRDLVRGTVGSGRTGNRVVAETSSTVVGPAFEPPPLQIAAAQEACTPLLPPGAKSPHASSPAVADSNGRGRSPPPRPVQPPSVFGPVGTASSCSVSPSTVLDKDTPMAILSCVTVPSRQHRKKSPSPAAAVGGADYHNYQVALLSEQPHHAVSFSGRAPSEEGGRSTMMALSHASFRSQPVRPFAPVANVFASADVAEARRKKHRPAVERHDLPFDVTPANDFKQLPYPLTGLGHAVPYAELQDELGYILDQNDKIAAEAAKTGSK